MSPGFEDAVNMAASLMVVIAANPVKSFEWQIGFVVKKDYRSFSYLYNPPPNTNYRKKLDYSGEGILASGKAEDRRLS